MGEGNLYKRSQEELYNPQNSDFVREVNNTGYISDKSGRKVGSSAKQAAKRAGLSGGTSHSAKQREALATSYGLNPEKFVERRLKTVTKTQDRTTGYGKHKEVVGRSRVTTRELGNRDLRVLKQAREDFESRGGSEAKIEAQVRGLGGGGGFTSSGGVAAVGAGGGISVGGVKPLGG